MNDRRVILAQELHDGIAQDLVGLGFSIDSLLASSQDLQTKEALRVLRFTITELIDKVRLEIHQLRSASDLVSNTVKEDYTYELMRVIAEILRNVSEHSHATHLSIQISDNGIGGARSQEGSFGIVGIQERINSLAGDIRIDSSDLGTTIRIELPLER
jgi:two-component system, NarL family, sensor histidine kinase LiaS